MQSIRKQQSIGKQQSIRKLSMARSMMLGLVAVLSMLLPGPDVAQAQSQQALRIGGSLALTGPLGQTGLVHKIAAEIAVEQINARGGLLGRQIELTLRDDQSRPDVTRTLYEQLLTVDKMDLVMGPYGTGAILSAMGVAQRYNKVLLHNTFGLPAQARYEMQFSVGGQAFDIQNVWPATVFDAVASSATPPKTVAIVTSKFPSVHFVSAGAREQAKKRGIKEVLYLEWDFGNRDFGPIAARIKEAKADFVWAGSLGIEPNMLIDAMKKIDYTPPLQFYMFPSPGPMAKLPDAKNALALTVFEEHAPFLNNAVAANFVKTFHERGAKANLADTSVELMASVQFATWQVLEAAVNGAKSLDDKTIAAWLKKNKVNTIIGEVRWDGQNNFMQGTDLYRVKQLQNGKWNVVWPREMAAPGARLLTP